MENLKAAYILAQEKHNRAEKRISVLFKITIALCIALMFFAEPLAERFFSFEVTETIDTYVCYTTTYGTRYHAGGCGYLWNSSHETTVYYAEKHNYSPCTKCTPTESITLKLTEKFYWNITKTKMSKTSPNFMIWLCGTCCLFVGYYGLTITPRKKRNAARAEMKRIKEEQEKQQKIEAGKAARRKEEERQNNNRNVLCSLGADNVMIPKGVTLLSDGTPIHGQANRSYPYGTYTVFISPSGCKFHTNNRCYRNVTAIHLFKLPHGYTPCKNCANGIQYPVVRPEWYTEIMSRKRNQPQSETASYERLLKVLQIGAGVTDVYDAIQKISAFYIRKGIEIPEDLYCDIALLTVQEKFEKLVKILELGLGVSGIENVTNNFIRFYKEKGITFPDDIL